MNGSMAEGISTSPQTCPSDPQGLFALEGLPSPLPLSHLHVNDLGLTPSPGSQLQLFDAFRDEQNNSSDRDVNKNPAQNATRNCADHVEDRSKSHQDDGKEGKLDHVLLEDKHTINAQVDQNKGLLAGGPHASSQPDGHCSGSEGANDTVGELYDPLFDSDNVFEELDAVFHSQKRSGEDAFPEESDSWSQSRKRQATELIQSLITESPDKTPSLSSLDSSLQHDQGGTGPHTPNDIEKQQPPALFDSMDLLFEDPPFDVNLDTPDGGHFNFDFQNAFDEEARKEAPSAKVETSAEALELDEHDLPSVSEITKARFSLNDQHILANTNREVLQRVYPEPEYLSPYPAHGGPLGYYPSAPGIHIRCIEVSDDRNNYRLSSLRSKVQQLSFERNKYRHELSQLSDLITVDPATGKTNQQLLLEQNAMLRRVCSRHQSRVEQYKQETIEWKNKLHDLGTTYNNLLYELRTQKETPSVAPIPTGYKPPRARQVNPTQQLHSHSQPSSMAQLPKLQPTPSPAPNASTGNGSRQPVRAEPLMIDLTETSDDVAAEVMPTPEETRRRTELLQSLRSKKYGWLGAEADGQHGFRTTPAPQGSPRPEGGPQDSGRSRSQAPAPASCKIASVDLADSDDLARTMEEELAQGSN